MTNINSNYIKKTFGVSSKVFFDALKLSPVTRGNNLGAISELMIKKKLEGMNYEVKRIKEKWKGEKPLNHHGDFYIRKKRTKNWFVLESKGLKSNAEDWLYHLDNYSSLKRFLKKHIDKIKPYKKDEVTKLIDKLFPGFENDNSKYELDDIMKKIKVLVTHFVSQKSTKIGREIATARKDEFHMVSVDLFLRTGKHEFIFADPKKLKTSKKHKKHLQQNYLLDILIKRKSVEIDVPWSFDFNMVFRTLTKPIKKRDLKIDERSI